MRVHMCHVATGATIATAATASRAFLSIHSHTLMCVYVSASVSVSLPLCGMYAPCGVPIVFPSQLACSVFPALASYFGKLDESTFKLAQGPPSPPL